MRHIHVKTIRQRILVPGLVISKSRKKDYSDG